MTLSRLLPGVLALGLFASVVAAAGPLALAQSVDEAESDAAAAAERVETASGLVDEAVERREELEVQLAGTISRVNDLAAKLSILGSDLDRTAAQLGFADVEIAGIMSAIEVQAVDTYMTALSSPSVSMVNSASVEHAIVVSSFVEDVVGSGRASVDDLVAKRRTLETLQERYLAEQSEYRAVQEELNAEIAHLADLYERADARVANAVREAQRAREEYQAALSAVELARARQAERERQAQRAAATTTTTSAGDRTTTEGRTWDHPPNVERWRSLVETFFPTHRVEEALRIMDCESNGDPDAYNPYSSASGLFQFLPSTWESTSPRAGYPNSSPFEAEANTASAAWLANRYEELGLYYWEAWSCKRVLD